MTVSFWSEGPERVRRAAEERRKELDRLAGELRKASEPKEQERLLSAIREILEQYQPSEDELSKSLFFFR